MAALRVLSTSRISAGRTFPPAGLQWPVQTLHRCPEVAHHGAL